METNTKKLIEDLLQKLGLAFDSVDCTTELGQDAYKIKTDNPEIFIGQHGDTLRALNHIVKKILHNQGLETKFMIDVNDYRSKQIHDIQETAQLLASRAQSLKYDVEMQPMSSYERMIVHAALGEIENIATESIGAGRDRRVIIKYTT